METILQFSFRRKLPLFGGHDRVSDLIASFCAPLVRGAAICVLLFAASSALAQRPLGTDVSGYQTSVNWTAVKNAGVSFAWAKATESTGYTSPQFATQMAGAKSVGIYIGAYHFARPSSNPNLTGANSADSEAAYFWGVAGSYIKYGGNYLVPMLDWEDPYATNGYSSFNGFTTAYMGQWVNEWCNSVSNHAAAAGVPGLHCLVYTGTWYSTAHTTPGLFPGLNSAVTYLYDTISSYNGQNPQTGFPTTSGMLDTYPWPSSWKIWQYADTNWSGGDADVYNGNLAGFIHDFVIGGTNVPYLTTPPADLTVGVGSNATFSAKATGQSPIAFQWYAGGKIISGATSSNCTIANVQLANAGSYFLVMSNSWASVTSSVVFLSVLGPRTNSPGSVAAPANMVSWWPAEGNGIDIYGGNNGALNGGMYYTNGEVGMAFHFDGSTGYLTPTTATNPLVTPWTLCVWVNRQNALGTAAAIMGDATCAVKLEQYNGTREIGYTKSGVADYVFKCTFPQNIWTHLALVNSGSTMSVYSNGVFVTSTLYSNGVAIVTPSGLPLPRGYIGGDFLKNPGLTDMMLGSLDEMQIYSRALSATEVANIYHSGSAGLINAPNITSATSTGGQLQLQLVGLTGKNVNIFTSTNLVDWTSLGSVANSTGSTSYTASTTNSQLYYRVEQ